MHFPAAVLATLIAAGSVSASDPSDSLLWCHDNEQRTCLATHMDMACYNCLHAVEASCPGDFIEKGFIDCMCHIPSDNWSRIKQCLDDPATNCAKDRFDILHSWEVGCFQERENNRYHVCNKENRKGDPDLEQLAALQFFDCDGNPGKPPVTTSTVSTTASTHPGSTSTTVPTTSAAPSAHSTASSATDCETSTKTEAKPTKSGNSTVVVTPTVPIITAGAAGSQVCLALVGLAAIAAAF